MHKKVLISLIVMTVFSIVILYNIEEDYTFDLNGVDLAVNLDGNPVNSLPAKGNMRVDVSCSNAYGRWIYDTWELEIDKIEGDVSCDIDFVTNDADTFLNSHITSLAGTVQGTGEVVNENGIRYEGKNPNNYILFNEELWRVIGVFDTVLADGTTTQTLTKIIKEDSIGGLAWDTSGTHGENEWDTADLKTVLNGAYLNSEDGTSSGYCFGYKGITGNCDFRDAGIQNEYQNMIADVTWNIGGYSSAGVADTLYSAESLKTSTGKIGLMNLSDYGYSVLSSSCARTTSLSDYDSNACAGNSWVYKEGYEWTINENSSNSSYVWRLHAGGAADNDIARYGCAVRPVLSLESTVKYLDGAGSITDPLIIELG